MNVCQCGYNRRDDVLICPMCGHKPKLVPTTQNPDYSTESVDETKGATQESGTHDKLAPSKSSLREVKEEAKQRAKNQRKQEESTKAWQKQINRSKARARRRRYRRNAKSFVFRLLSFVIVGALLTAIITPDFRNEAITRIESLKNQVVATTSQAAQDLAPETIGTGCLSSMGLDSIDPPIAGDPSEKFIEAVDISRKSARADGYQEYIDVVEASLFGDYPVLTPRRLVVAKEAGKKSKMGVFDGLTVTEATSTSEAPTIAMFDLLRQTLDESTIVTQEKDGTFRYGIVGGLFGLGPDGAFRFALKNGRIAAWCQELSDGSELNRGWASYQLDSLGVNVAESIDKTGKIIKTKGLLGASELRGSDMKKLDGTDITNVYPLSFGQTQVLNVLDCPLFITPNADVQKEIIEGMAKFSAFDAVTGENYVLIDSVMPGGTWGCAHQFAAQIGGEVNSYSWN